MDISPYCWLCCLGKVIGWFKNLIGKDNSVNRKRGQLWLTIEKCYVDGILLFTQCDLDRQGDVSTKEFLWSLS